MARNFLTPINLNGLELQDASIQGKSATAINAITPASGGRIYYDSTNNILKVYNGSAWQSIATGGSTFTLGSTSISIGGTTTTVSGLTLGSSSVWNGDAVGVTYGGTGTSTGSITGTGALTFTAGGSNTNVVLVPNGTGSVNVSNKTIINVADPVNDTDAANKRYVDNVSLGVNAHDAVVALISGTIAGTYTAGTTGADGGTGVGAYITYSSTGATTVDTTVTLAQYDRVLVTGGVTADSGANSKVNGIYIVTTAGSTGVATVLTRALDFDNSIFGDVTSGDLVYVTSGTANGGTQWVQTVKGTATTGSGSSTRYCVKIDTDAISFTQFSGVSSTTAGAGLVKNGNAFDVNVGTGIAISADAVIIDTAWAGQTAITTLGTIATGTWNATTIGTTKGGTGLTSFTSGGAVYATSTSALTTGTLPVASGGTGATTFTSGSLLKGAGTAAIAVASGTDITTAIGANAVTLATNTTNVGVTNDAATATSVYIAWVGANTGNNAVKTTSAALSFVPSTGTLSATVFSGSGASLTSLNGTNISSGTVADARIASALTSKTYNGLTLTAASTGFTIAGGTTSKTLTINNTVAFTTSSDSQTYTFPGSSSTVMTVATPGTLTGKPIFLTPSGTAGGSINLPSGPSVTAGWASGDVWNESGVLKLYNGSATKTIAYTDSAMTSTTYVGTTAVALNRSSAALALTGITSIQGVAATSFIVKAADFASTTGTAPATYIYGGEATAATGNAQSGSVYIYSGPSGSAGGSSGSINIGAGEVITLTGTVKLPSVGTSGFVKLSTGGTLIQDTNTYLTSSTGVSAIAGTTNQITASGSTGSVTLSLPSAVTISGAMTAGSFVKTSGTSSQFLKADGSVDSSTYLTSSTGVTTVNGSSGAVGATANSNGAYTKYYRTTNSAGTTTTINHALGTWVICQVFKTSDGTIADVDVTNTSTSGGTTTVGFAASQTAGDYTIVIIG